MKGDFTRLTFDPTKRYTKVLKQQGRVDLDADWNELNEILDNLDRTTRIDVIGECGVPIDHPGFGIGLNGAGTDLTVSAGRFYSHGVMVELAADSTYLTQPELPNPPALNPVDGRIDSVFLDVWERHITAIEDPDIREVALGGPDTATRVQTIFQLRVTQNVGNVTCDAAPFPNPSGGLMLASVTPVPPSDDLCAIAPTGGFRGLENRLYRVEVHDSSGSGQATFKWSRDNGAIAFSITEFPTGQPTKVRVSRLGRDQVLTFRFGDWVEVSGDQSELAGVPGTLAQILDIDEANRELTLSKNVSAHAAETHPKLRRWDQPSDAVPIGVAPVVLEDGLQIQLSGGPFLTGDYWTFPARTATGQAEFPTTPQPPRGIEHFYCPLALVAWHVAGGVVTAALSDCRPKFPPLTKLRSCCCCTVSVGQGGDFPTLPAALAALASVAGPVRICLRPGVHVVTATIVISRNEVTIEGCGAHAKISGRANPVFSVDSASDVSFESVWIQGNEVVLLQARRAKALRIEDSHLESSGAGATMILQSSGLDIFGNTIVGAGIHVADGSSLVLIRENDIADGNGPGVALGGLFASIGLDDKQTGVLDVQIVDNRISGMKNSAVATSLDTEDKAAGDVEDVTIARNQLVACALLPATAPFQHQAVGGIVLQRTRRVRVRENHIIENGVGGKNPACGIFFTDCTAVEVDDNRIEGNGVAGDPGALRETVYQGGILAITVFAETISTPSNPGAVQATVFRGDPAITVRGNTVVCPSGQPLRILAAGATLVEDNSLTTNGFRGQPGPFPQPIVIVNAGQSYFLATNAILPTSIPTQNVMAQPPAPDAVLAASGFFDGRILFQNNQVTTKTRFSAPAALFNTCYIISLDDVAVQDNQFVTEQAAPLFVHVLSFGFSTRMTGNRFSEVPLTALLSGMTLGQQALTSLNQATHCLFTFGVQNLQQNNQIAINAFCEGITSLLNRVLSGGP